MLFYVFLVGPGILVVLGLYVLLETKRAYDKGNALSRGVWVGWWVLDMIHCLLVVLSLLYTVWPLMIFGEKYLLYKESIPRYIGIPKRKEGSSTSRALTSF